MRQDWPKAVVFDLDGTLIDSACDIADALNACLGDNGLPQFDEPSVVGMIGGGARVLVERAVAKLDRSEDRVLLDSLHANFVESYAALGAGRSAPFPGVIEVLEQFSRQNILLGVCTNKPAGITAVVLDDLDLSRWFQAIVGETSERPRKPDPAMLYATLTQLGVEPADAVMVGDTPADVGAARNAGVAVVAVGFGYATVPADELGADYVIERMSDLPAAVAQIGRD